VNSFVTYLANDKFLEGVLVLNESLRTHNKNIGLACMVTDEVSTDTIKSLKELNIKIYAVPWIKSSRKDFKGRYNESTKLTFTKLNIFNLPFNKILYLDADIVINKNIENLFSLASPSAVYDTSALDKENIGFNAGVMLLKPSKIIFEKLKSEIDNYGGNTDQTLLNKTLHFSKLNKTYNKLYKPMTKLGLFLSYFFPPAVIHFNGNKPWNISKGRRWEKKWYDGFYYHYKNYRNKLKK